MAGEICTTLDMTGTVEMAEARLTCQAEGSPSPAAQTRSPTPPKPLVSDRPVPGNHQASRCEREDANAVKTNGVDGSSLKGSMDIVQTQLSHTSQMPQQLSFPPDIIHRHLAQEGCQTHMLEYIRAHHPPCDWSAWTCVTAARGGHLEVLRWLRAQEPPCPWDAVTCSAAASAGHLPVLEWLRSQAPPCDWDEWTCAGAARGGHLQVLEFLRSQTPPCPWDPNTCEAAAETGHLPVLRWLRRPHAQCPWDKRTCWAAIYRKHQDVMSWSLLHDCPVDEHPGLMRLQRRLTFLACVCHGGNPSQRMDPFRRCPRDITLLIARYL